MADASELKIRVIGRPTATVNAVIGETTFAEALGGAGINIERSVIRQAGRTVQPSDVVGSNADVVITQASRGGNA